MFSFHLLPTSVQEMGKFTIEYVEPICGPTDLMVNLHKKWAKDGCVTTLITIYIAICKIRHMDHNHSPFPKNLEIAEVP
jgi:hypothetical protein